MELACGGYCRVECQVNYMTVLGLNSLLVFAFKCVFFCECVNMFSLREEDNIELQPLC